MSVHEERDLAWKNDFFFIQHVFFRQIFHLQFANRMNKNIFVFYAKIPFFVYSNKYIYNVSNFVVQLKESAGKKVKSNDIKFNSDPVSANTIFGVELEKYLTANKLDIPFVITKCIKEVDENGVFVKGIYRVSAVKSKVNQLCEAFENYGNKVDLTDVNPNIVANVLKSYLRELPQPLFTFELYPEFLRIAKLFTADSGEENKERYLYELRSLLKRLPKCYYAVVSCVMQHLHRISAESETNQMTAHNLAVIFGPTLLHCSTSTSRALLDNVHQIRVIELMITCADKLFPPTT